MGVTEVTREGVKETLLLYVYTVPAPLLRNWSCSLLTYPLVATPNLVPNLIASAHLYATHNGLHDVHALVQEVNRRSLMKIFVMSLFNEQYRERSLFVWVEKRAT